MKRFYLLLISVCAVGTARAQTVPFDATAPMRGGSQNQTVVPPVNPALNQSTIQGPPQVQRTTTSYDAQPSRPTVGTAPSAGTPEQSPTSLPDVREQGLVPQQRRRQSSDIAPSRSSSSSNINQRRPTQPAGNSTQP